MYLRTDALLEKVINIFFGYYSFLQEGFWYILGDGRMEDCLQKLWSLCNFVLQVKEYY